MEDIEQMAAKIHRHRDADHENIRAMLAPLRVPDVVDVLSKLVAPFPPGVDIKLADGRRGIVVSVPPEALDRPLVRIIEGKGAPYEVALVADPGIRIAGWDLSMVAVTRAVATAVT